MFRNATTFNKDIGNWYVSKVTPASVDSSGGFLNMFLGATRMIDLGAPITPSERDLQSAFFNRVLIDSKFKNVVNAYFTPSGEYYDDVLNSTINVVDVYGPVEEWKTERITDMSGVFMNRSNFNADLSEWDLSSVTTIDNMFKGASSFNGIVSTWDTS